MILNSAVDTPVSSGKGYKSKRISWSCYLFIHGFEQKKNILANNNKHSYITTALYITSSSIRKKKLVINEINECEKLGQILT